MIMRFLIGCLVTAYCSQASADIIVKNFDFEGGSAGLAPSIPDWSLLGSPSVAIPGGLSINGEFIIADGISASPNANQFAVLRNSPTDIEPPEGIIQTIDGLTVGNAYIVSFYQSNAGLRDFRTGIPDRTGTGFFSIGFGGQNQAGTTMSFEGFGAQTWSQESFLFTASSTSQELRITASGFTGGSAANEARLAIDGVTVSAVPEPTAPILGLLTVVCIGLRRSRAPRSA